MALLNTMTWALEADTVEYGEYQTGIRTEGATYAAFSFIRKVGQAVGAAVAGYALAWAGYNGAAEGHRPAPGCRRCWTGCSRPPESLPAACFVVALLIMATYPLTEAGSRRSCRASRPTGPDGSRSPRRTTSPPDRLWNRPFRAIRVTGIPAGTGATPGPYPAPSAPPEERPSRGNDVQVR